MKIGITYNLKDELSPGAVLNEEIAEEYDTPHTIDSICEIFSKNGHEPVRLGGGIDIIDRLRNEKVNIVFNIAEGCHGRNRESHIPAILEMLDIPYTGSDPLALGATLDKTMTKKIAYKAGIPTPRYMAVHKLEDLQSVGRKLHYPMIVKPAWEGSSKGIYNSSKVGRRNELDKNIKLLFEKYPGQPVLIEEYIEGREITVGVIGNEPPHILGLMEIVNKVSPGDDIFYSLDTKRDWKNLVDYESPPDINRIMERHIRHYALMAYKEFDCRDVARIDFRISKHNKIFMLELNPLPGLSPEYADLVIMARKNGIEYENLIMSILNNAIARYKHSNKDVTKEVMV